MGEKMKSCYPSYKTEVIMSFGDEMETKKCQVEAVANVDLASQRYPYGAFLILINELFERFSFHGMRTILVIYLTQHLLVSGSNATAIYHGFSALTYFMCIFGGLLADSYLGKYKTILSLTGVYAFGLLVLALGSIPAMHSASIYMTGFGLVIIAIGAGGIKPCRTAFGGDQYVQPSQVKSMICFYAMLYFVVTVGLLAAMFVMKMLLEHVSCFGGQCYALAFGLPAAIMCLSLLLSAGGRHVYRLERPAGNIVMLVLRCICNALCCCCRRGYVQHDHWLDHAKPMYGRALVDDIRAVCTIIVLFLPLTIFWALFEQQSSLWLLQASNMNGTIGPVLITPESMLLLNPLLVLLCIPLCQFIIYPVLRRLCIRRPLQKIGFGIFLVVLAILLAGFLQLAVEPSTPRLPGPCRSQFRIYNTLPCNYTVFSDMPGFKDFTLPNMSMFSAGDVSFHGEYNFVMTPFPGPKDLLNLCPIIMDTLNMGGQSNGFYVGGHELLPFPDDPSRSPQGDPVLRVLSNLVPNVGFEVQLTSNGSILYQSQVSPSDRSSNTSRWITQPGAMALLVKKNSVLNFTLLPGEVGALMISTGLNDSVLANLVILTMSAQVHILWQVPQYILLTLGEVMIMITGLSFAYKEAPASMKTVVQAFWLLMIAIGNVMAMCLIGTQVVVLQSSQMFIYAGLMFLGLLVFMLQASCYIPRKCREDQNIIVVNLNVNSVD